VRFRAFFTPTNSFYAPNHVKLANAIAKVLDAKPASKIPQAIWDRLKDNYKVIPSASGIEHDDEVAGRHTKKGKPVLTVRATRFWITISSKRWGH
jgi:hypothetical protein